MSRSENRKTRTWCRAYSTSIANRSPLAIRSISASSEVACDRGRAALARAVDSVLEMLSFDFASMALSPLVPRPTPYRPRDRRDARPCALCRLSHKSVSRRRRSAALNRQMRGRRRRSGRRDAAGRVTFGARRALARDVQKLAEEAGSIPPRSDMPTQPCVETEAAPGRMEGKEEHHHGEED